MELTHFYDYTFYPTQLVSIILGAPANFLTMHFQQKEVMAMRKSFLIVSLVLAACLMYLSSVHQAIGPFHQALSDDAPLNFGNEKNDSSTLSIHRF